MYRVNLYLFFLLSLSILTWGCERNLEPDVNRIGYNFLPVATGNFIRYEVERITYTLIDAPLVERYQLREVIGDSFTDIDGDLAYQVFRYRRNTSFDPWLADSLWSVKLTQNQAIRIENSQPLVKMRFPVEEGLIWDGNVLNANERTDYQMLGVDVAFNIDDEVFERSLIIQQNEECSKVSLNRNTEVFARDIGLIYKQQWEVSFCISPECVEANDYCETSAIDSFPPAELIDFGTILTQKILDYGVE